MGYILLLDRVVRTKRFIFKNKFLVRRKKNAIQEIGRRRGCFQGRGQCQQQRLPVAVPLRQQKAKSQRAFKVSRRIQETIEIGETRIVEMRKRTCVSLTQPFQEPCRQGPFQEPFRKRTCVPLTQPFQEPRRKKPLQGPIYDQSQGPRRPRSSSQGSQRQEPRPSFVQKVKQCVFLQCNDQYIRHFSRVECLRD